MDRDTNQSTPEYRGSRCAGGGLTACARTAAELSNIEANTSTTTTAILATSVVTSFPASAATADDATNEQVTAAAQTDLTSAEIEGLLWMREEEKLARDVYLTLSDLWGVRIFSNISDSEQTHMDAVLTLLDRYELGDPAATMGIGEFTNPEIQALYEDLVERGSGSLEAALEVGAHIEDLDIVDLRERGTTTADIDLVYANLEKGSSNHLRAFVSNLERRGETYTSTFLTQEAYDKILSV